MPIYSASRPVANNPDPPPRGTGERGYTLILVLVAGALLSLFALSLVRSGRRQARLADVESSRAVAREAILFGESQVKHHLMQALDDTGFIRSPSRYVWQLPPGVRLTATVRSLNGRINLNELARAGPSEPYRRLIGAVLHHFGYPDRALRELVRWIEPRDERSPRSSSRYGGYGYRTPGRDLRHLDELALVSGFRRRGVPPMLRRFVTVHGSGNINVHQIDARMLNLIRTGGNLERPNVSGRFLASPERLRQLPTRLEQWRQIRRHVPFLTDRDDSFAVVYRVNRSGLSRTVRGVYRLNEGNFSLTTVTRHAVYGNRWVHRKREDRSS